MKTILLIVALAFVSSSLIRAKDNREECFFRATVIPVAKEDKKAIATSYDSRFFIKLRIEEFLIGSPLLSVGDEEVFAIHSLAMMFSEDLPNMNTEKIEGKKYMFFFSKTTSEDGSVRFGLDRGEYSYNKVLKNQKEGEPGS